MEPRILFQQTLRSGAGDSGDPRFAFAASRFEEGERTVELLRRRFPDLLREGSTVLDLGSGNGGMLFPFAPFWHAIALDTYADADLRSFAGASGLRVHQCLGVAQSLPFASRSIDLVLLAEVLEHLSAPSVAGAEIMRVLKPGGVCLISTPPRLVFALRRDPHFGIRFLVALPDLLQRLVVRLRFPGAPYDVHHIYATTWGIARQFPRGSFTMHVISHRSGWTRHLSWNYLALQRRA
ncbi:MAG TPA: class I SAM-dependent methyltransferase [Thermoanaerobaculia bacterium]|jgi:SAM-dependent methyltransferase|nr:class I SAM-dependent methyltransferase [Thermoanaerobaculia bacterium]